MKNKLILFITIALGLLVSSYTTINPPQQIQSSAQIEDGVYIGSWLNDDNTTAKVEFHIKDAQVNQLFVDGTLVSNNSMIDYLLIPSQKDALYQFDLMVKEFDDVRITKTNRSSEDSSNLWIISYTNTDENKILPGKYVTNLPDETLIYTIIEGEVKDITVIKSNEK